MGFLAVHLAQAAVWLRIPPHTRRFHFLDLHVRLKGIHRPPGFGGYCLGIGRRGFQRHQLHGKIHRAGCYALDVLDLIFNFHRTVGTIQSFEHPLLSHISLNRIQMTHLPW
ncbi:hypothetical protein D3C85_1461760 [compost metagenome]